MRIGLINQLHGRPGGDPPPPTWVSLRQRALLAEEVGFDTFVFEDALLYRGDTGTAGCWEAGSVAAALAAVTERIEIGPSVFNAPYRSPALLARIADTIDEISGGRFIFGLGAGNTEDSDYEAFGFPTDHRYSRFEEAIQIIHGLLHRDAVDFRGTYHSAIDSELVLRGPRPQGPPIVLAAGGPKMMRLAARYADGWNWWAGNPAGSHDEIRTRVERLEEACAAEGRDPGSLRRTLDLYSFDLARDADRPHAATGTVDEMAEMILAHAAFGFDEVRVDLFPKSPDAIEMFAAVVERVQAE